MKHLLGSEGIVERWIGQVGYPPEISSGPEKGSLSMAGVSDRESVSVFGAHVEAVLVVGNRSARLIPAADGCRR